MQTLSGDSEVWGFGDGQDLAGNLSGGGFAELVDVDGEDVSNEEEIGGVAVGSGHGVAVDVVEGSVDENGRAGGSLGKGERGDSVDGVTSVG